MLTATSYIKRIHNLSVVTVQSARDSATATRETFFKACAETIAEDMRA